MRKIYKNVRIFEVIILTTGRLYFIKVVYNAARNGEAFGWSSLR